MSTSTLPGFIRETCSLVTSVGRLGAGHQHRADHQVGVEDRPLDLVGVGRDGLAVALVDRVDLAQPVDVAVEQQHLGLHAERDRGGVHAGHAGADDDDLRRVDAGDAAHQDAAAALRRASGVAAPTCGASRPATSLIGASSGSERSGSSTVS